MKKSIAGLASTVILAATLMGAGTVRYPEVSVEKFKSLRLGQRHEIVKAFDAGDFYILQTRSGKRWSDIYVTKDMRHVVFGTVVDAKSGKPLESYFDLDAFRRDAGVVLGEGEDEYFLFTDPSCPFCVAFERLFETTELPKHIRLCVYFYPLNLKGHEDSAMQAMYIMDRNGTEAKAEAMRAIMLEKKKPYKQGYAPSSEAREKLARMQAFASRLHVRGTPSLFDANLEKVRDWRKEFVARYGIRTPISRRVLGFLERKVPPIRIGRGEELVYLFADPSEEGVRSFLASEEGKRLLASHDVRFWPIVNKKGGSSVAMAAYLLAPNEENVRSMRAMEILSGKGIPKEEMEALKRKVGEEDLSQKIALLSLVKEKENIHGEVVLYDKSGAPLRISGTKK